MTTFSDGARPRLSRGARLQWDEVREKHLLLVPEGVLELNETAAAVLELCDGERTLTEIAAELEEEYPEAPVREDVRELLTQIAERGFVVDSND